MPRAMKMFGLVAVVGAGALLPLFGDPRPSPVSHPEWARMVLRSLSLLQPGSGLADQASQVFATLSGKGSRAFRADLFTQGTGVDVDRDGEGNRRVRAIGVVGEVVYPLAVARGGDYRMRVRLGGPSEAEAAVTPLGKDTPIESFKVLPVALPTWLDAGSTHLDPGAYKTAILLPRGSVLEFVEFSPPCLNPIEPRGGWKPSAVTSTADVALTALQALDLESELPPAAPPLEWRGSDMRLEEPLFLPAVAGLEAGTLHAGTRGGHAVIVADLQEAGFYTLSVFGDTGGGQSWVGDGCRKSVLCPTQDKTPRWRVVLSGEFSSGPHSFSVTLGPDSSVGRLRLERKKDASEDYGGTVRRLGLDLGPDGPVTRDKANEAKAFIERRHALAALEYCGDVILPGTLVASAGPGDAGAPNGSSAPVQPPGGVAPPLIPPQEKPSPYLP
jgi:hypothetical protein